jgi:uncharacterized membrane protein
MKLTMARPTAATALAAMCALSSITGTAGYLLGRYHSFGFLLPVSFRGGRAVRFVARSYAVVLTPLWTQLLLALLIGGLCALLLYRAESAESSDPQAAGDRERMLYGAEAVALLGAIWISFQLINAYSLAQYWSYRGGAGWIYQGGLGTAIVLSIVVGGHAVAKIGRPPARHVENGSVWRFKALYVNPADPALFVPARYGYGLTLNFGRPLAIAIMAAILLAGLGGPVLIAVSLLR